MLELTEKRETPYVGFPLCLRQIHLSRVFERMGVSLSAESDLGLCPKNLRAFEKARPKLSLTGAVREIKKCAYGSSVSALSLFYNLNLTVGSFFAYFFLEKSKSFGSFLSRKVGQEK